jgi:hypothetical protein
MLLFHERVLVKVKDRDAIKQWFNNGGFGGVTVAQELLLLRIAESLVSLTTATFAQIKRKEK